MVVCTWFTRLSHTFVRLGVAFTAASAATLCCCTRGGHTSKQSMSMKAAVADSMVVKPPPRDHNPVASGIAETHSVLNLSCLDVKSKRFDLFRSLARQCWLFQVSMVDGSLFDSLDAIARSIRGSKAPFGGIQLVLAGWSQTGCTYTQCMQWA